MSSAWAVTRLQLRILRRDPWFLIIFFAMPLAIMPLMKETMGVSLVAIGFTGANGAEQVVPGQIVLFGFFVAGSAAFSLFREHGWRTWDRLRASPATPGQLLAGFGIPWVLIHFAYQAALLVTGALVLDLGLNVSVPALALVMVSFSVCVVAIVLLAASTLRTINQVQVIVNLGAMVFGGLGGALVPREQLPGWARAVGPFTPQHWAMSGFRDVFLDEGGIAAVWPAAAVLTAIGLVASVLAISRFQVDETKEFFA